MTVVVLAAIAAGVGLVSGLPATQPASTMPALCMSGLTTVGWRYIAMPNPVRLEQPVTILDIELQPPPLAFRSRVSPAAAWGELRRGGPLMERTATYRLYLATVVGATVPNSGGVDWVVVATHIAYIPSAPPSGPPTTTEQSCIFGAGYAVIDATSGRYLMG